jgi:hypothetical protein
MVKILYDKYGKATSNAIDISAKLGFNASDLEDR